MKLFSERWHFTVAWLIWIGLFFLFEGLAVFNPHDARRPTLTNHIRDFLDHQPTWVLVCAWVFMIWLTLHYLVDLRD
jgi:hypothetical protein